MAPGDKGRWGEEGAPSPPVVIVHPYDPSRPAEGGDIRYTIDFLRFYRRHGVSVTVVGILRPGAVPPADGGFMPIHHAYEWLAFGLKLLARLPFLPLPPNAVIQTHQPLFMFPVVLVDWRRPKVCTLGAVRLHMARRRWPRWYPLIALVYGWLERLMIRRVDRFVAVSPYIAGEYLRRYPQLARKLTIIPVGVDTDLFAPRPGDRGRFSLPADARVVTFVGRIERVKRVDFLLDAFDRVVQELPHAHLLIVGRGTDEARVRALQAQRRIPHVHFLGEQPPDEIPRVLAVTDVLAVCSESEGGPAVIREALACGVPVVSTDVGDAREVLSDPAVGVVVEGGVEEFARTLTRALAGELGFDRARCREVAQRYSFEATGQRYLEMLRELAGGWRPPQAARRGLCGRRTVRP